MYINLYICRECNLLDMHLGHGEALLQWNTLRFRESGGPVPSPPKAWRSARPAQRGSPL